MSSWRVNAEGQREFCLGRNAFSAAERESQNCADFRLDDEDELVVDPDRSCYNCRYRRWTTDSFVCLKG